MNEPADPQNMSTRDVAAFLDMPERTVRAHAFTLGAKRQRRNGRPWRFVRSDVLIGALELGLDLPDEIKTEAEQLRSAALAQQ